MANTTFASNCPRMLCANEEAKIGEAVASVTSSHIAFSDESYTADRYRSVATLTLARDTAERLTPVVSNILTESSVKEFKWEKLRQARERFAALKLIDLTIQEALRGNVRVDVLIWDTEDSRHTVKGRDDIANLQRMYYHLFRNVLTRWPSGSTWMLHPDQNSAMDWQSVGDYLDIASWSVITQPDMAHSFRLRIRQDFQILEIAETVSETTPLGQVSDLFAGLGVFSHKNFSQYSQWFQQKSGQLSLFSPCETVLSNSDCERSAVLKYLDDLCKCHKLGVSLKTNHGLRTYNPTNPINSWLYEPQSPEDKAPTIRSSKLI